MDLLKYVLVMNITLKVDEQKINEMLEFYSNNIVPNNGEYIYFFAKIDHKTITAYKSKNNQYKVVFNDYNEALIWDNNLDINDIEKKKKTTINKANWINKNNQIGSDEVGTGDFFGPICVVASFVTNNDIEYLRKLGVDDSKRLSDEKIFEIGQKLINKIPYCSLSLDNEKYNQMIKDGYNMNSIKALMHNYVLSKLNEKYPNNLVVLDKFCPEDKYYSYLNNETDVLHNIVFQEKGESYYPSIAVSSIIARYSFLKKMEKLNEKYQLIFPFGAGKKVDEFVKIFIEKYNIDELKKITKNNFKNFNEINK